MGRADERPPNFFAKRLRSFLTMLLIVVMLASNAIVPQVLHRIITGVVGVVALVIESVVVDALVFVVAFRLLTVAR